MKKLSNAEIRFILKALCDNLNGTIFFEQDEKQRQIKNNNMKMARQILDLKEDKYE